MTTLRLRMSRVRRLRQDYLASRAMLLRWIEDCTRRCETGNEDEARGLVHAVVRTHDAYEDEVRRRQARRLIDGRGYDRPGAAQEPGAQAG